MSRIHSLAARLRSAADKVDQDAPPSVEETAALLDVLSALPADLSGDDTDRLLSEVSQLSRRRRLLTFASTAAAAILSLAIWYAVTHLRGNSEPVQVALEGPALRFVMTGSRLQMAAHPPIFDLSRSSFGELHITAQEECTVFTGLLERGPRIVLANQAGTEAQRRVKADEKTYFPFTLPDDIEAGTFLIVASREQRDLEALVRKVVESIDAAGRDHPTVVALVLKKLREQSGLAVHTSRFRRSRG